MAPPALALSALLDGVRLTLLPALLVQSGIAGRRDRPNAAVAVFRLTNTLALAIWIAER